MSKFGEVVLSIINNWFPKRRHPLNLQNENQLSYGEWQFQKGEETISLYLQKYSVEEMFAGKTVLDLGCGAGGKSIYYASLGAEKVIGVDIVKEYQSESKALAEKLGYADKFHFVLGDAANLPFATGSFDTIIMNDFMEHVPEPEKALKEAYRLLSSGGRIYLNFPPYNHPFGAHLHDAINVPWVHVFFKEQTMINVYKKIVSPLPDGKRRIEFRFSKDENGGEHISYINKMTIRRFADILTKLRLSPVYYHITPIRKPFEYLCKIRFFAEFLSKEVTCVIEKSQKTVVNNKAMRQENTKDR
ncbi:MAG: class I SAM-dependent methyltransferase [Clostridia bacterium]|nr:class I SAM-dependent methyltransferase [Clostridia bacterium]